MSSPEPRSTAEMLDVVVGWADERRRRQDRRRRGLVLASIVAVVAVAGGALLLTGGDGGTNVSTAPIGPSPTYDRPPLTEPEGWEPMARSPLSGRANPVTAWTGSELLVWRGEGAFNDGGGGEPGRTDGAAYDPRSDSWRPMAESPLPAPGNVIGAYQYASAWTGRELLVWGGKGPEAAAYDPKTDSWRSFSAGPLEERTGFGAVWTGSELVVVGGSRPLYEVDLERTHPLPKGQAAAYDPTTDTWRMLPAAGVDRSGQLVWTGSEVLFLADSQDGQGGAALGLALDPKGGSWRRTEAPPIARFTVPPVWTGSELVVMGAAVRTDPSKPNEGQSHAAVAIYDPKADRWTTVDSPPGLRVDHLVSPTAVWTGHEVVVLGAPGFAAPPGDDVVGAAFDPKHRTWRMLPPPGLSGRGGMGGVWAGSEVIVWGGAYYTGFTSEPAADGARYRPGPGR